ncbi:MAG TPA: sulfatase-like hydrolase/transferase [Clostridiales bacterium]|nr:sulfatase-like hydrolase/transferase [Clostridiales bacterium]
MAHPLIFYMIWAFLLNFIMECLARRSILEGGAYLLQNPILFLYNVLIILMTLSISLLFKRRIFVSSLISLIWFLSAVANCVLLGFRTTPFSAIDLTMVTYALSIINIYLSKTQIILITVMALLILALIIFIGVKAPKVNSKVRYIKALAAVIAMVVIVAVATGTAIQTQMLTSRFGNLADAYKNYGFAYCLSNSFIDSGIDKPQDYSKEAVDAINETANATIAADTTKQQTPNIIFVQLESFFDPNELLGLYYSRNPVPHFDQLKEDCISGYLTVPTVSAGTANTEFEILSGMSLKYFGAGEYPYKTVLLDETCESIAYNLEQLGYSATAIHNNRATFYGRDEVYPALGFTTFISKEYMTDLEYTPTSWVKDKVLTKEILKSLEATEGKDFVFTVSVQGHGKYPTEFTGNEDYNVYVYGDADEARIAGVSYLVNQFYEMDQFIGDLVATLADYDEDTVLVLYGDHLPGLDFSPDDMANHSIFQTPYVIWSNFGLNGEDRDLTSYELSSYVLNLLGIHEGAMTRYQQASLDSADYGSGMKMLEYDMLYGENYSHNGVNPYELKVLQMGVDEITISDAMLVGGDLYVFGSNLTEAGDVYINNEMKKTSYYNPQMIVVRDAEIKDGDVICVKQSGKNKKPLSSTNELTFTYREFEATAAATGSNNR